MKYLLISIFFFSFLSCRKEVDNKMKADVVQTDFMPDIEFIFPDTVFLNKSYNTLIKYQDRELDTFNIKADSELEEDGKARFLFYLLMKTNSITEKLTFKNKKVDTFVSKTNTEVLIKNLKFNKLGLNYIDGLLTDEIYITLDDEDIRIITKEYRITKKVIVIDSTLVIKPNIRTPIINEI